MYLFKIKDYFKRLTEYNYGIPIDTSNYRYKKHECERDVFVRKSLKSYKGKYFVIYDKSSKTELFKKYIFISNIIYINSRSGNGYKLSVWYIDATEPLLFKEIDLTSYEISELIGKEITKEEYYNVANLFMNDLPEVNFTCHAYDFSKFKPRGWSEKNKKRIKVKFEVLATDYDSAFIKAKDYCKVNNIELHYVEDLK